MMKELFFLVNSTTPGFGTGRIFFEAGKNPGV
jgi:hypothetical protein